MSSGLQSISVNIKSIFWHHKVQPLRRHHPPTQPALNLDFNKARYFTPSDQEAFFDKDVDSATLERVPGGYDSDCDLNDEDPDDDEEEEDEEENSNRDQSTQQVSASAEVGAPSSTLSEASASERHRGLFAVRLDSMHGMQRVGRHLKKTHRALNFRPFMACLRDAIFMINKDDVEMICAALKQDGLLKANIQKKMETNWVYFLKHC
ncbi:hypothetical protein HK102_004587 [Quaeritorhiza haematococci]|nr:hypothetical protein HK102_004587 [Quaeritorhiza haematococci]